MKMNPKSIGDDGQPSKTQKLPNRKDRAKKIDDINFQLQEIEKEFKSLNLKVPDKEFYAAQRGEDSSRLNDVKGRRENQFKAKKVVDEELKEVNKKVQSKYDAVGKLKSTLQYKTPERVDEAIRVHESQLQKLQMKPNDQRRIRQEILKLKESKSKIQEFLQGEEEIKQLKEKQRALREQRDENVRLITAIKQEESAARSRSEQHKKAEDEEWTIYKENMAKRDRLRNEKDQLLKQKKELNDQYRKEQSLRRDYHSKRESLTGLQALLLNEQDTRPKEANPSTRIRTERKKPYEDEIKLCNVLLAYLAKHESQAASTDTSSIDNKEVGTTNDIRGNEVAGAGNELEPSEDIYRGVRRKPSRRERRRKQHGAEAAKKLEHHVDVLERFLHLSIKPPATVAEISTAERAIREKKKFLRECQKETMDVMRMQKAKSTPHIASIPPKNRHIENNSEVRKSDHFLEGNLGKDGVRERTQSLTLNFSGKNKSWPSIPRAIRFSELYSPNASPSKDTSASNSEYDLDSPRSAASSISITDTRSIPGDEKRRSLIVDEGMDFTDSKIDSEHARHVRGQHKVHFANEISQVVVDEDSNSRGDKGIEGRNNMVVSSENRVNSQLHAGDMKLPIGHPVRENGVPSKEMPVEPLQSQKIEKKKHSNNPNSIAQELFVNNYDHDDSGEESEGKKVNIANDSDHELQFEIDDIPSGRRRQNSHSKSEDDENDASSEDFNDEADELSSLQYQIDDRAS